MRRGAVVLASALLLAGCQEKVGSSSDMNGGRAALRSGRGKPGLRSSGLRPAPLPVARPPHAAAPAAASRGSQPRRAASPRNLRGLLASGAALAAALLLAGCQEKVGSSSPFNVPWSSDMYMQPSVQAQEVPYETAPATVPVAPEPPALPHMVASERLKNPIAPTKESLARGKVAYETFCIPCHGADGKGQGPVAAKFVPPPPLDGAAAKGRTDGYIYATIRLGSLSTLMPAYGYRLTETERWDLVNYVRSLQGLVAQADPAAPTRKAEAASGQEAVRQ